MAPNYYNPVLQTTDPDLRSLQLTIHLSLFCCQHSDWKFPIGMALFNRLWSTLQPRLAVYGALYCPETAVRDAANGTRLLYGTFQMAPYCGPGRQCVT